MTPTEAAKVDIGQRLDEHRAKGQCAVPDIGWELGPRLLESAWTRSCWLRPRDVRCQGCHLVRAEEGIEQVDKEPRVYDEHSPDERNHDQRHLETTDSLLQKNRRQNQNDYRLHIAKNDERGQRQPLYRPVVKKQPHPSEHSPIK